VKVEVKMMAEDLVAMMKGWISNSQGRREEQ